MATDETRDSIDRITLACGCVLGQYSSAEMPLGREWTEKYCEQHKPREPWREEWSDGEGGTFAAGTVSTFGPCEACGGSGTRRLWPDMIPQKCPYCVNGRVLIARREEKA